jgi:hypothetical protein
MAIVSQNVLTSLPHYFAVIFRDEAVNVERRFELAFVELQPFNYV